MSIPARSTDTRRLAACFALALLFGCAGPTSLAQGRPALAEARAYSYTDDQGLAVMTYGARVEQPVNEKLTAVAQVQADRVVLVRAATVHTHSGGETGHTHDEVDAVTSASVTVTGGTRLDKTRVEATGGVFLDGLLPRGESQLLLSARVSSEPDYQSYSARAQLITELFQQNTTVAGFLAAGHDRVLPIEAPPGELALWPARHERLQGGLSVSQLASGRLVLFGGAAVSHQGGTLDNPYRRALVRSSLFPEQLPGQRTRITGYAGLSYAIGPQAALHLRQGAYMDSWGVKALIPELAFVQELGPKALISLRYRYYRQSRASFYRPVYDTLQEIRTGDRRLGELQDHRPGLEGQYTLLSSSNGVHQLRLLAGYTASFLRYLSLRADQLAHIVTLGMAGSY